MDFLKAFKIWTILVFTGMSSLCFGQNTETQISRLQRSIYVYNMAQQVNWPEDLKDNFKIGVLGPDRTVIDFTSMAQKRQIKSLPVKVVNFLSVKDVKDVDILYVNRKYNFQMPYILRSIKEKGILVISEDYNFNAAMVNMVRVGNSYRHQVNEQLLKDNNFTIAPTLKSYSIKTSQKWLALFQQAQDSLTATKKQVRLKDSVINVQKAEIVTKNELIDTIQEIVKNKDNSIKLLLTNEEIQKKTIEEKRLLAQELEEKISHQIEQLAIQDTVLEQRNLEIAKRQKSINRQKEEIGIQEKKLNQQSFELTLRENLNWLLAVIALLLFAAGLIAFKSYRTKDVLSKKLTTTNSIILKQSEQLEQKNQDLEQFAYIASHDLQEPLNTISSFIGLIKEDYREQFDDLGKQSLDFIEEASLRMKKLITVLLEYSRIGKSRTFVDVDCDQLMKDLELDITSLVDRKKASIRYSNLPVVSGSAIELRLLFQNLITNALKFCPEERLPILKINAIKTDGIENPNQKVWRFSFQDNGIGIRKEHQDRIFSIFQRLHTNEEFEGTGIGLAHCKKIITIHNGDIWVESEFGKGTTFYFTIPC